MYKEVLSSRRSEKKEGMCSLSMSQTPKFRYQKGGNFDHFIFFIILWRFDL